MNGKFMVYAKGADPENNMSIECSDIEDMDKYADACRGLGYEAVTKVEPVVTVVFKGGVDMDNGSVVITELKVAMCPRCKGFLNERAVYKDICSGCGQSIEWGEVK